MNFDYIRMLTYLQMRDFVTKVLIKQFNTNLIVKLTGAKTTSNSQQIEFEAVASNGIYITGIAYCTDFECKITTKQGVNQVETTYNKEWAKFVYKIIKEIEFSSDTSKNITSTIYKQEYNKHCQNIRDAKLAEAEKECEASLLK